MVPLSQRLLSAFISEEGTEQFDCDIEQGDTLLQFSSDYASYGTYSNVQNEHETDFRKSGFEMDLDFKNQKIPSGDNIPCNGFVMSSNFRSSNIQNFISGDELLAENNIMKHSDNGSLSEFGQTNLNHLQTIGTSFSGTSTYECQFEHMSLDDRVLMELNSIGLYPESVVCTLFYARIFNLIYFLIAGQAPNCLYFTMPVLLLAVEGSCYTNI